MSHPQHIIVGMSGGVDSSVSALLLKKQGFHVEGLFMKNWDADDTNTYCSAEADLKDARQVCKTLQIPLHTINFADEYWANVFDHCLQEYQRGRTPNPDVLCNREIKFKVFLEHAKRLGASVIATGHYAQIKLNNKGLYELHKGLDPQKDQSYFLYLLNQQQLADSIFPVGHLPKQAVRTLAAEAHLITHDKKDSTGICFVGERPFKHFLQEFLPTKTGKILNVTGETIGEHEGLMYYTLGQRKGLNIGGRADSNGAAWYVVGKDIENNILYVAQGHDHAWLFSRELHAIEVHWIGEPPSILPYTCWAKTRYRQSDQACTITALHADKATVKFDVPQRAVTPGQSIVFYQENICLGGGIIDKVEREENPSDF